MKNLMTKPVFCNAFCMYTLPDLSPGAGFPPQAARVSMLHEAGSGGGGGVDHLGLMGHKQAIASFLLRPSRRLEMLARAAAASIGLQVTGARGGILRSFVHHVLYKASSHLTLSKAPSVAVHVRRGDACAHNRRDPSARPACQVLLQRGVLKQLLCSLTLTLALERLRFGCRTASAAVRTLDVMPLLQFTCDRYRFSSVLLLTDDDDVKNEAREWALSQVSHYIHVPLQKTQLRSHSLPEADNFFDHATRRRGRFVCQRRVY
jgi:hypothetical protein